MIQSSKKSVRDVVTLCADHGISRVVFSPGSRNAPLVIGFSNHSQFTTYVIPDERVAAFYAMGMAQASGDPVVICCTSGSAALNYYPAIAEAFYQRIPLIVLTADRPAEWVDQNDGQTIRQENVFSNHIRYQVGLKRDVDDFQTIAFNQRVINEALNAAVGSNKGPVHINMPFDEPLYDLFEGTELPAKSIVRNPSAPVIDAQALRQTSEMWSKSKRKIILVGQSNPQPNWSKALTQLAADPSVVVLHESTSNTFIPGGFGHIDRYVMPLSLEDYPSLTPDILLTLGGAVVSKKIKAFLRNVRPAEHWHVGEGTPHPDTYQVLSRSIDAQPHDFLERLPLEEKQASYPMKKAWEQRREDTHQKHIDFCQQVGWGDMKAIETAFSSIPKDAVIHLANSTPVRYAQLFDQGRSHSQYCNRGTSGIDGTLSTAAGFAEIDTNLNVIITGDLSFFYDSNAFFSPHVPHNLRTLVINNGGGGIFRYISGPQTTGLMEKNFEAAHSFTAKGIANSYCIDYSMAHTEKELAEELKDFFDPAGGPKILEVFTPSSQNAEQLKQYFRALK